MEASAPEHLPHLNVEAEPVSWQPRATWAGARLFSGGVAFFFISFLFAYIYLKLNDVNHDWKIGHVSPPFGWGLVIAIVLVASAVLLRLGVGRAERTASLGFLAAGLAVLAVILQVITWTTLGFGPASGGYASVYTGWTSTYTVLMLGCAYWIQTQAAGLARARRHGLTLEPMMTAASLEACSFFWSFYVAIGVVEFICLYIIK
jgi:heme/copper-type cytochrome/quinol oxidase subunit 3